MSRRLKVAVILSLGYTGTTWINLVLGSRPQGFALGVPNKITTLARERAAEACLVHGAACDFWPRFLEQYSPDRNFFLQLADFADTDFIVTNNPRTEKALADLRDSAIDVRYLQVLRDGRANIVSYMRHHYPGKPVQVSTVIEDWLLPRWQDRDAQMPTEPGRGMRIRYEDFMNSFDRTLAHVGEFLEVGYPADAIDYWRYPHHLPEGNSGTVDLMRRFQGMDGLVHQRSDFYAKTYAGIKGGEPAIVHDDAWRDILTTADRLTYDFMAGDRHAAYGYERDRFTIDEVVSFLDANRLERSPLPELVRSLQMRALTIPVDADREPAYRDPATRSGGMRAWWRRLRGGGR